MNENWENKQRTISTFKQNLFIKCICSSTYLDNLCICKIHANHFELFVLMSKENDISNVALLPSSVKPEKDSICMLK